MQDETLMPPRCCRQEIPIALAKLTSKKHKISMLNVLNTQQQIGFTVHNLLAQLLFLQHLSLIALAHVQSMYARNFRK